MTVNVMATTIATEQNSTEATIPTLFSLPINLKDPIKGGGGEREKATINFLCSFIFCSLFHLSHSTLLDKGSADRMGKEEATNCLSLN